MVRALPGIQQLNPEDDSAVQCVNCGAPLVTTEEIREEKGRLRTVPSVLSDCQNCGTDNSFLSSSPALHEDVGHESVKETLTKGDRRFIVDHRRGVRKSEAESKSEGSKPKVPPHSNGKAKRAGEVEFDGANMPVDFDATVDWRNDLDSFRTHMSCMEGGDEDVPLDDKVADSGQPRHSVLFFTELGASVEQIENPPEIRHAWDDGETTNAVIKREYEKDTNNWKESYDVIAEDHHPELGISVKVRRAYRPGVKGYVSSAPVLRQFEPKRPEPKSSSKRVGRKIRSHSTPDIRQHSKQARDTGMRCATDDATPLPLGGFESDPQHLPGQELFLRPETPALVSEAGRYEVS